MRQSEAIASAIVAARSIAAIIRSRASGGIVWGSLSGSGCMSPYVAGGSWMSSESELLVSIGAGDWCSRSSVGLVCQGCEAPIGMMIGVPGGGILELLLPPSCGRLASGMSSDGLSAKSGGSKEIAIPFSVAIRSVLGCEDSVEAKRYLKVLKSDCSSIAQDLQVRIQEVLHAYCDQPKLYDL